MSIVHRRQPVRLVVTRVLVVADPDERGFKQADDRRQNLFARHSFALQVTLHPAPDCRKGSGEGDYPFVLILVASRTPVVVVAILFPIALVAPRGLDMSIANRANPDVPPSRRDRQPLYSREGFHIAHGRFIGSQIDEIARFPHATDSRPTIGIVAEAGLFGGVRGERREERVRPARPVSR